MVFTLESVFGRLLDSKLKPKEKMVQIKTIHCSAGSDPTDEDDVDDHERYSLAMMAQISV